MFIVNLEPTVDLNRYAKKYQLVNKYEMLFLLLK